MKKILIILMCVGLLLYCGYDLYSIYFQTTDYEYLDEFIITPEPEIKVEEVVEEKVEIPVINEEPIIEEVILDLEPEYQLFYNWEELQELNSDIKGWLYINDDINYPVVQASNNDYYLRKNLQKEYDVNGSIFFDKNVSENTKNKIIHGHNMGSKKTVMFSLLEDYFDNPDYIKENPYIYYTPMNGYTEEYQLAFVLHFNIKNLEKVNYLKQDFLSEDDFYQWLELMKSNSFYSSDIDINFDDELLTLSTCDKRFYSNGRFVVIFKKIS